MATKRTAITTSVSSSDIVELQVYISSRGRSVAHGTLLVDGEMRTVKHELSDSQKESIGKFILTALYPG